MLRSRRIEFGFVLARESYGGAVARRGDSLPNALALEPGLVQSRDELRDVRRLRGVVTSGNNSDAIHTRANVPGLDEVSIDTAKGQDIVLTE
jgi:hypothetical protein